MKDYLCDLLRKCHLIIDNSEFVKPQDGRESCLNIKKRVCTIAFDVNACGGIIPMHLTKYSDIYSGYHS